jgi:Protein of unknown function (DUF3800)
MDESGDPGRSSAVPTYTVGVVCVADKRWVALFEQLIEFRRELRRSFGLYMRPEVKGSELAKGAGPWDALHLSDRQRKYIYARVMRLQANSRALKTYAVVVDKSKCADVEEVRSAAWRHALERVRTLAEVNNTTAILFPDSGQYVWLRRLSRRMRRHAPVGSVTGGTLDRPLLNILIDDPVERDSQQSYMIQLADLNAYAAYRNRTRVVGSRRFSRRDGLVRRSRLAEPRSDGMRGAHSGPCSNSSANL